MATPRKNDKPATPKEGVSAKAPADAGKKPAAPSKKLKPVPKPAPAPLPTPSSLRVAAATRKAEAKNPPSAESTAAKLPTRPAPLPPTPAEPAAAKKPAKAAVEKTEAPPVKKIAKKALKAAAEQPLKKPVTKAAAKAEAKKPVAPPAAKPAPVKKTVVKAPVKTVSKPAVKPAKTAAAKTIQTSAPELTRSAPVQPAPSVSSKTTRSEVSLPEPGKAGEDSRMVLMLRDPQWLCVYWELAPADARAHRIGEMVSAPLLIVRLVPSSGEPVDFTVFGDARTWYIPAGGLTGECRAELGYIGNRGRFVAVLESNALDLSAPAAQPLREGRNPIAGSAPVSADGKTAAAGWFLGGAAADSSDQDASFMEEVAGMDAPRAGNASGGSEQMPARRRKAGRAPGGASELSGARHAPALGRSSELLAGKAAGALALAEKGRGFWLLVETELILYGATEPDAVVTVAGERVQLRPDGTFTVRYALPDGLLPLPVRAASGDGAEERAVTATVEKQTT